MSFDLEMSVKPARFHPYGMHCGTSGPDVGFSQRWTALERRFSLLIPFESTSSPLSRPKTLFLFPSVFIFLSNLFCFRFFFCLSFSLRILYVELSSDPSPLIPLSSSECLPCVSSYIFGADVGCPRLASRWCLESRTSDQHFHLSSTD